MSSSAGSLSSNIPRVNTNASVCSSPLPVNPLLRDANLLSPAPLLLTPLHTDGDGASKPSEPKSLKSQLSPVNLAKPSDSPMPLTTATAVKIKKQEDDFDLDSYYARLHAIPTFGIPETTKHVEEKDLEDIDLSSSSEPASEAGITAELAQNFTQFQQVLPDVANAVLSSFSSILSLTKSPQKQEEFQSVAFEPQQHKEVIVENDSNAPPIPMINTVGQDTPSEIPQLNNVPPMGKNIPSKAVTNQFRCGQKKMSYSHFPGLTVGETEVKKNQSTLPPPNVQLPPIPQNLDSNNAAFYNSSGVTANPYQSSSFSNPGIPPSPFPMMPPQVSSPQVFNPSQLNVPALQANMPQMFNPLQSNISSAANITSFPPPVSSPQSSNPLQSNVSSNMPSLPPRHSSPQLFNPLQSSVSSSPANITSFPPPVSSPQLSNPLQSNVPTLQANMPSLPPRHSSPQLFNPLQSNVSPSPANTTSFPPPVSSPQLSNPLQTNMSSNIPLLPPRLSSPQLFNPSIPPPIPPRLSSPQIFNPVPPSIPSPHVNIPQIFNPVAPNITSPQLDIPLVLNPNIPSPQVSVPSMQTPSSPPQVFNPLQPPSIPSPQIESHISSPLIFNPGAPSIPSPQVSIAQIPSQSEFTPSSQTNLENVPTVPMFSSPEPNIAPPAMFAPSSIPENPIPPPSLPPPSSGGNQFRLSNKKRLQYYSGPIAADAPAPAPVFPPQPNIPSISQPSLQFPPQESLQFPPQQNPQYPHQESFQFPSQQSENKGGLSFGLGKLQSAINLGKLQSAVTTFFDPQYNAKKEPEITKENDPIQIGSAEYFSNAYAQNSDLSRAGFIQQETQLNNYFGSQTQNEPSNFNNGYQEYNSASAFVPFNKEVQNIPEQLPPPLMFYNPPTSIPENSTPYQFYNPQNAEFYNPSSIPQVFDTSSTKTEDSGSRNEEAIPIFKNDAFIPPISSSVNQIPMIPISESSKSAFILPVSSSVPQIPMIPTPEPSNIAFIPPISSSVSQIPMIPTSEFSKSAFIPPVSSSISQVFDSPAAKPEDPKPLSEEPVSFFNNTQTNPIPMIPTFSSTIPQAFEPENWKPSKENQIPASEISNPSIFEESRPQNEGLNDAFISSKNESFENITASENSSAFFNSFANESTQPNEGFIPFFNPIPQNIPTEEINKPTAPPLFAFNSSGMTETHTGPIFHNSTTNQSDHDHVTHQYKKIPEMQRESSESFDSFVNDCENILNNMSNLDISTTESLFEDNQPPQQPILLSPADAADNLREDPLSSVILNPAEAAQNILNKEVEEFPTNTIEEVTKASYEGIPEYSTNLNKAVSSENDPLSSVFLNPAEAAQNILNKEVEEMSKVSYEGIPEYSTNLNQAVSSENDPLSSVILNPAEAAKNILNENVLESRKNPFEEYSTGIPEFSMNPYEEVTKASYEGIPEFSMNPYEEVTKASYEGIPECSTNLSKAVSSENNPLSSVILNPAEAITENPQIPFNPLAESTQIISQKSPETPAIQKSEEKPSLFNLSSVEPSTFFDSTYDQNNYMTDYFKSSDSKNNSFDNLDREVQSALMGNNNTEEEVFENINVINPSDDASSFFSSATTQSAFDFFSQTNNNPNPNVNTNINSNNDPRQSPPKLSLASYFQ